MSVVEDADLKVRDVWKRFPHRRVVGSDLTERVGARGWAAPAWARTHAQMFARCGVPDPFHPGADDPGVGLGEVGIAQPKREPAPHALPPAPKSPAGGPKLPNVPQAPQRVAPPVPGQQGAPGAAPSGKAAPKIGEIRRDDTADLKKKLAEKERLRADPERANAFKVQQPVAKIPMRPEGAVPARPASTGSASGTASGASGRVPVGAGGGGVPALRPVGAGPRAPMRPYAGPVARPTAPPPPEEIDLEPGDFFGGGRAVRGPESPPEPPPRMPATVANAPPTVHLPSDRAVGSPVRPASPASPASVPQRPIASTPTASAPQRPVAPPPPASAPPPPAMSSASASVAPPRPVAAPPAPPNRAPPRPGGGGGGGMDDLFGMGGGGDNTRIRMPKAEDAAAAKPRRPMVVDPSQAPGGIDRRPPAAKPPVVTPSPSSSAPSARDLPDE